MRDPDNRELYLVEIELESHDFYRHIFPQITKFFAFFRNSKRQHELVEKLFSTIDTDPALRNQFKKYLGHEEVFKFLTDLLDASQNILLVIDGDKPELPEITDTYSDTWGKMVKVLTVKKFVASGDSLFTVDPEFETIEYAPPGPGPGGEGTPPVVYSEEFHLEGVRDNVKAVYRAIRGIVQEVDASLVINPQKYYISIKGTKNILFMTLLKKKVRLVVMLPEQEIRAKITKNNVKTLSEAVRNFYNGPCAVVEVEDLEDIEEVGNLIKLLVAQDAPALPGTQQALREQPDESGS